MHYAYPAYASCLMPHASLTSVFHCLSLPTTISLCVTTSYDIHSQAPLLSIFRVAFNFRFTLPYDMFPNIDRIANTSCPIFVVHGTKDEVVPFWNGQALFLAAPISLRARPFWVQDGCHNNLEELLREDCVFFNQFIEFLSEWVPVYSSSRAKSGERMHTGGGGRRSSGGAPRALGLVDMDFNAQGARDSFR
jgi:fermentation-respiration switch protein FrsA (DUF1100 family)